MTNAYEAKALTAITAVFSLRTTEEQVEAAKALTDSAWHSEIIELFNRRGNDKRTALTRTDCQEEGNWGHSTQDAKEKSGVLRSFKDGKKRLITASSFYQHLITRLILSHPVGAPALKGAKPTTRFWLSETKKSSEASA